MGVERVTWEVLVLLTGVATVEGIELGDDVLVAAVNLLAGTAAVVVLGERRMLKQQMRSKGKRR